MKNHPPSKNHKTILQAYDRHLRQVVGLAPKTCQDRWRDLRGFLEALRIERSKDLAQLTPINLVNYLTGQSVRYEPASLRNLASSLRHFLRFAQQQGWAAQELHLAVPKISCGAQNDLPVYLSVPQLDTLLASWDHHGPGDA